MLLKNAQIYTMEEEQVIKGDILIQNGRIAAIENNHVFRLAFPLKVGKDRIIW